MVVYSLFARITTVAAAASMTLFAAVRRRCPSLVVVSMGFLLY